MKYQKVTAQRLALRLRGKCMPLLSSTDSNAIDSHEKLQKHIEDHCNQQSNSKIQTDSADMQLIHCKRDFQQCGILTWIDSDEPVQPPFKLFNSRSVSSLPRIEYSSDWHWSDCAYAQADLSLCCSHIPYCWKSHVAAQKGWICYRGLCPGSAAAQW